MEKFNFREELALLTPILRNNISAKIYVYGSYWAWMYNCKLYKYLAGVNLCDEIDGYIYNELEKDVILIPDKPKIELSDIDKNDSIILVAAGGKQANEIYRQVANFGFICEHSFFQASYFFNLLLRWEYRRLTKFKDKHKGARCFLIGNGSSLTPTDLDKLNNEITFSSNRIYLMFKETDWRPSYYVVSDPDVLSLEHKKISSEIKCPIFYASNCVVDIDEFSITDGYFFQADADWRWEPNFIPRFSNEIITPQCGRTVSYFAMQIAVYMGFEEIYLLGMDNHYSSYVAKDGSVVNTDANNYFTKEYKKGLYLPRSDIVESAFQVAREYCEQIGVKIKNATRGGKLEVFERVDFDSLF